MLRPRFLGGAKGSELTSFCHEQTIIERLDELLLLVEGS
jgi:hypothetical protein